MPNENNQNNNQNDIFKQQVNDAIKELNKLKDKIDKLNGYIGKTENASKNAADAVTKLGEAFGNLDGRTARKLPTIMKHLTESIKALESIKNISGGVLKLASFITGISEISKIDIKENNAIDTLAASIVNLNSELKDFLELSKGLNDVDIQKLTNIGVEIKDAEKPKKVESESAFIKRIKRSGYGQEQANKELAEANYRDNPTGAKLRAWAKEKLASGDFHKELGLDMSTATDEDNIKVVQKYNEFLNNHKAEIENTSKNTIDTSGRKEIINAKEASELKLRDDKDRRKAIEEQNKNTKATQELSKKIQALEADFEAGIATEFDAKKLTKYKIESGYFKEHPEINSGDYLKDLLTKVKTTGMSEADINDYIKRLNEEHQAKIETAGLNRSLVNRRTKFNTEQKVTEAQDAYNFAKKNQKKNAWVRIFNQTFGSNSPILQDVAEATGMLGKDYEGVETLKKKRALIEAEYNDKMRAISNTEITDKQRIRYEGLSAEQKKLLNNKNLTDDQRNEILKSADSNAETQKKLNDLAIELEDKRTKAAYEKNEALLKNEEELNNASLKAAGSITKISIGLKILTTTLKALSKATKYAAQSNESMLASLRSTGASVEQLNMDSITYFTNELKNSEQRLKSIGRNLGNIFGGTGSGFVIAIDELLKGLESITDKLADTPKLYDSDLLKGNEKSKDYSTSVLEYTASKLDEGIYVNGKEIKIDKEVAYKLLSSTFGQSKSQGFDNASSANLSSLVSNMAAQVQSTYGTDYATASQQISDAIFNGSNSASAYGIVVDDQILAGYAALEKELDIVNVEYTDAYKSALRYEMAEKMMADGNSKEMQDKIKQWKQLGDVMQTASGTLFDFQEVQQITGKNFEIPEVDASGQITNEAESFKDLNEQIANNGDLFVQTSLGMMSFQDAMIHVNGNLNRFKLYMNEATGEMILATDDYLPSLTLAEQSLHHEINSGIPAIATYARYIGLTDQQMDDLAESAGFSLSQLASLKSSLDYLTSKGYTANFNYSDITEAKKEAIALNTALLTAGYLMDGNIDPEASSTSKSKTMDSYSKNIQDYIRNEYKFDDGTTVDDISGWEFLNGFVNPFSKKDKKKVATWADFAGESGSTLGKFANGYMDFSSVAVPALETAAVALVGGKALTKVPGVIGNGASKVGGAIHDVINSGSIGDAMFKASMYAPKFGHADGGLSFKDHVARVSEGNMREVILPLTSQDTVTALAGALTLAGAGQSGPGVTVENININNDGVSIAENNQAWRKVATRLVDEISILQQERGDYNYGIK